jgi:hypothetical protein
MQHRVELTSHPENSRRGVKRSMRRLAEGLAAVALVLMMLGVAWPQEMMPGMESVVDPGAPPITDFGGGDFFSQDLSTTLRVRYNTESYGQHGGGHGNLDIGTMQVATFEDAIVFFDGQVTLNDVQGVGFNVGLGYRWMDFQPYPDAPGRMQGVSIWADGTRTEADNFFPQVGISYESLGEMWDMRVNTYIPLGSQDQTGDFLPTGEIGFEGNSISQLTQAVVDSSFYVGEAEFARRLGSDRDAWAFAGPYFLANDSDDSAGYRAGLRGYAFPDLLLQIAVSNDDIFDTNATFSLIWFVGRTRTDFQPACGVPDRFREPVLRNDYVALAQSTVFGGVPLTQPDGDAIRIVHVDSFAGPGGDGTFENPFDMLTDVDDPGASQAGDIVFVHSQSVFNGDSVTLLDDQRLLGEGLDASGDPLLHMVATAEEGTIEIPESAPGARNLARPQIIDALGDAVTLANNNEVANFDFIGGDSAVAGANLTGTANIHDLSIIDSLLNGIELDTVADDITLANLEVTNGSGFGISLANIATTSTVTLDEYAYDGGVAAAGGIELDNFDGTFTATDSTLTNGTLAGVAVTGGSDGTITFQDTVEFTSIDGTAFDVNGFTGTLSVNSDITNDTGRSISVQNVSESTTTVTFNSDLTDTGQGILVANNADGTILFSGDLTMTTGASPAAITLMNNNNAADINFGGVLDIDTTSGTGFLATGGGTLTVSNTGNSITSTTGQLAQIVGMTISNLGVNFADINRTAAGATNAVLLQNNSGGPITIGMTTDAIGDAGTIVGGTVDAIAILDSANVSITGLRINNSSAVSGVRVEKFNANASTINLNDLQVNGGDIGVEVLGGGTGALTMTLNDSDMIGSTAIGIDFDNVDAGSVTVNNATVDGNSAAATAGVRIRNSNATFTIDQNTEIREVDGTDFLVDGGSGTITMNGDIINATAQNAGDTLGRSVVIQNITGGSVTLSPQNSVTDDNDGMLITNNSGGTINLQGTHDLDTATQDAVTITNNTGANITLSNLDIDTTSGRGFVATGGGTLAVLGTTNTINTTTGVGLQLEDMAIANTGVAFQSVTVTNGGTNAIILEDLTGTGQVSVGNAGGALDSGGTLTTTGNAIVLRNVQNVDLRNMRIASAGGDGLLIEHTAATATMMDVTLDFLNIDATTGDGIDVSADSDSAEFRLRLRDGDLEENVAMDVTGGGTYFLLVEDTDIDIAAGATDAFSLVFSDTAQNGEITFRDNNDFSAAAGRALFIDSDGSAAKVVDLLIEDGDFFSSTNAIAAVDIRSRANTTMNATIEGNMFDAPGAANDFDMRTDAATGRIRLKLGDEDAADMNVASGGGGTFIVREITGDFDIFEVNDTVVLDNRNSGAVNTDPNDAAFDNLPSPPPLPTLP